MWDNKRGDIEKGKYAVAEGPQPAKQASLLQALEVGAPHL